MSLHPDFYAPRSVMWTKISDQKRVSHFDHCIEALRQLVICDADATVVTMHWYEVADGSAEYLADQGNPRTCANWDAHLQWQRDRQIPAPKEPLSVPKGYPVLPLRTAHPPPGSDISYH